MAKERLTRDEKKARTRQRLIDAAAEVFASKGYLAASLDEIADKADLTKGAVYSNFSSKEELFFEVLDEHVDRRLDRIADDVQRTGTIEDQAQEAGLMFNRTIEEESLWYLLGIEYSLYRARNGIDRDPTRHRERLAEVADLLKEVADQNGMTLPVDAYTLALIFNALGNGFALEKLQDPEGVPDDLFGTAVALIYKGLEADQT